MPEPLTDPRAASAAPRGRRAPLRPPWMLDERTVLARCSGCGECARACPEGVIARGRGGAPLLDFSGGECSYCAACARACPEGLFALPEPLAPPARLARIDGSCLHRRGVVCGACLEACPLGALRLARAARPPVAVAAAPSLPGGRPAGALAPRGAARPPDVEVDPGACNGCGACVGVCPLGAIAVLDLTRGARPRAAAAGEAA